jgi:hypothetical protein
MLNKIVNINNVSNKFEYYELNDHKDEGSSIIIENNTKTITVRVDRYSTIPFYYFVFENNFYGSTSLQDLLNNKPNKLKISLNEKSALFFLKTNTFINDHTLVNEICRIPYGCYLIYNKSSFKVKIIRYWNFSNQINKLSFNENLDLIFHSFEETMKKYIKSKKVAANISGGYDTRQILGFLVNNNIKFTGYTYGVKDNPDQKIAVDLSKKYNFNLIFKEWKNINFYKDNFEKNFNDTDGMLAFHHFHPFNIINEQKRNKEDIVLYGHFLDFFLQAWNYQKILEKDNISNSLNFIEKSFGNAGHFSIISNKEFSNLISNNYNDFFTNILKGEIKKLNYLRPEKIYDALYFIHHGTRRLLPQVQAACKYVNYALPGLNNKFFDNVWSIPGKIKKNNSIKESLIKKYYKKVCDVPILFNNYKLDYIGPVPMISNYFKILRILKSRKIGLLKPYFDFWGKEIYRHLETDLRGWIDKEIKTNSIFDYNFLNKDKYLKFLNHPDTKLSTYGTFITLSNFIKRNL